jgi:hypothetical protein
MEVVLVSERAGQPMIWWGLLSAPFIYAAILQFMPPAPPPAADLTSSAVLVAVGVLELMAAQVLWAQVKRGAFAGKTDAKGQPLPLPIIVWALDESAAVVGLVIAYLGAPPAWSFGLFGVAVAALLLNPYWTLEEAA